METIDWVGYYANPKNRKGLIWWLSKHGNLPAGVDPKYYAVREILDDI